MRTLYRLAPLALAIAATPALAQESDTADLAQRIDALQQQVNTMSDDRIRFNGFMSTGYARASNDAGFAGITESTDVYDLSLMALQASFDITDKTQAVMQIVGRGAEDWDPSMEWAYLSYRPTNDWQLRAGKMRIPLFMYSDFLEVGYAQPWARPPEAFYGQTTSTQVGVDAQHTYNLDNSSITTQVFAGFVEDEAQGAEVDVRNHGGVSVAWTDYTWTLRGVYATGELTLNAGPFQLEDERSDYVGVGLSFDNGDWLVSAEASRTEIDGYYTDKDAAYLSVGHRFGSLTPYAVVGWVRSQDNDKRDGLYLPTGDPMRPAPASVLNTRRDEYSLGLRWDVTPGIAIKGDVTHARGFEGAAGGLNAEYVMADKSDSTNVYTFKIDAAF